MGLDEYGAKTERVNENDWRDASCIHGGCCRHSAILKNGNYFHIFSSCEPPRLQLDDEVVMSTSKTHVIFMSPEFIILAMASVYAFIVPVETRSSMNNGARYLST